MRYMPHMVTYSVSWVPMSAFQTFEKFVQNEVKYSFQCPSIHIRAFFTHGGINSIFFYAFQRIFIQTAVFHLVCCKRRKTQHINDFGSGKFQFLKHGQKGAYVGQALAGGFPALVSIECFSNRTGNIELASVLLFAVSTELLL